MAYVVDRLVNRYSERNSNYNSVTIRESFKFFLIFRINIFFINENYKTRMPTVRVIINAKLFGDISESAKMTGVF